MTARNPEGDLAPGAMTEYLTDDWGFFIRSARLIEKFRSPFQDVEVHDSRPFGKLFRLDGYFMTSEKDEFFYHENLVHVAAMAHANPKRALIVGGGDGGSAEELLKHPSIGSVTLADDPRVELRIEDGFAYVRRATEKFDLIVLDLTDPGGPSTPLYTVDFYRACAARLAEGGAMTLHIASPIAHPARIRSGVSSLRATFSVVRPYLASIPLYGGLWMMACCSQTLDPAALAPEHIDGTIAERGIGDLQYYNGAVHRAAFALPNFVRTLVD